MLQDKLGAVMGLKHSPREKIGKTGAKIKKGK
jgi:hypothetical protein